MKNLSISGLVLVVASLSVLAEESKPRVEVKKTPATEARSSIGKNAVVEGTVVEIQKTASITRINFENPYPNQVFSAVVFANRARNFPDLEKLVGKTVEVSGSVVGDKDGPQIVLKDKSQLKVVEKAKPEEK